VIPPKLLLSGMFVVIAGLQFAVAAFSPWAALASAALFGLGSEAAGRLLGLRLENPWILVGLTMLACLAGVLAAAPIAVAEPQGAAALSPSLALLVGIARVLIRKR